MARGRALAAALAVALLAVAGAGGSGAQSPQPGGTVIVARAGAEPPCLNWVLAECSGVRPVPIDGVFEGAFEPGPNGYRSVLVSRAVVTRTPFAVTYRIRPEARWSDGTPVTAADFVFAYGVLRKHFGSFGVDSLGVIRSVRAFDAKTVRVEYGSKSSFWRSESGSGLPRPLPRHALVGQDLSVVWRDRIDDPRTGRPIGDGPFLVSKWDRGRQLTLVRNPRYWGRHPAYLDRVVLRFVSDPGKALRNGEVDLIGSQNPVEQAAAVEFARQPVAGIKVVSTPGPRWEHFAIRLGPGGHPALGNKLIRRALAYGIDREAIVRELYGDVAPRLRPLDSTVYLANDRHYRANWSVYRYDAVRAHGLLRQAGCRRAVDGIYVCAGERLSLRFVTTAGVQPRELTLRIVQAQLARIGVEVAPIYAPPAAFFGTILPGGDFDVALFGLFQPAPDALVGNYGCGFSGNFSGYCSRLYTADMLQLVRVVDPDLLAVVANRADKRMATDVPVIPLFQAPLFVAYRNTIHGVVPSAFNEPTWNAEDWWLAR